MWLAFVLAFVIAMAVSDLCTRKMPNLFTTGGLMIGLGFHTWQGGLLSALVATVIAFAAGVLFFHLGAIGGGDVKLITALAAMLTLPTWALAMAVAVFVAATVALMQVARLGILGQTIRHIGEIFRGYFTGGLRAHPVFNVANPAAVRAPFGVAAAVGTAVAVWLR